jgi:hypothetical protein
MPTLIVCSCPTKRSRKGRSPGARNVNQLETFHRAGVKTGAVFHFPFCHIARFFPNFGLKRKLLAKVISHQVLNADCKKEMMFCFWGDALMTPWRSFVLVLARLASSIVGCRSCDERGGGVPYEPHPILGGFLLQTGGIQLGPRTGQNGVRWQGDGQNWLEFGGGTNWNP